MEEVSKMSDLTTALDKTLENAGYVTRRMILAKAEIAQKALDQGIPLETVAVITGLEIETVREIAELGNRPVK
jgi:hypothetical protein